MLERIGLLPGGRLAEHLAMTHRVRRRAFLVGLGAVGCLSFAAPARPAHAQGATVLVGTRVGANRHGEDVRVKRSVGAPSGYPHRLQAIAVARMAGAEPAVVVRGLDDRWHPFEVTANFYGGGTSADNTYVREIYGLPSSVGLDEERRRVAAMVGGSDAEGAVRASRALAARILGVEVAEIEPIASSSSRKADKINVNATLTEVDGTHGPASSNDEAFVKGQKTAIEIRRGALDSTESVAATLFHEVQHELDYELTQRLADRYEAETRRPFTRGPTFTTWLLKRDAKTLPRADGELASDIADSTNGSTEATAGVLTFLAAMDAGATAVAAKKLEAYAAALTGVPRVRPQRYNPPTGPYVIAALKVELETAYRRMSPDRKRAFDGAFATIKRSYPSAWISGFDHATAIPRR